MSHFYDLQGNPAYTQPNKSKGGERPTTLADAKKLKLVPSVTTIIDTLSKPGLDVWKMNQVFIALQTSEPQNKNESNEAFKSRILRKSNAISEESAKRGNEIHNKLEAVYTVGVNLNDPDNITIQAAIQQIQSLGKEEFVPEKSFAFEGFGGKVDLHSSTIVLDYKTKNTDDFNKQLAYPAHAMQLAAYRIGLALPAAKCYNLFISTVQPGLVQLHEWKEEEIKKAEKMFLCLRDFWNLSNNM